MNVIIQQNGIKREIAGPFRLCLSRDDARSLTRCIDSMAASGCYGWVDICDMPDGPLAEGVPLPWRAE